MQATDSLTGVLSNAEQQRGIKCDAIRSRQISGLTHTQCREPSAVIFREPERVMAFPSQWLSVTLASVRCRKETEQRRGSTSRATPAGGCIGERKQVTVTMMQELDNEERGERGISARGSCHQRALLSGL